MKRCTRLAAVLLALTAAGAKAQVTDNFDGPRLLPVWKFDYPIGYEDPEQYTVGNGSYTINAHNGSINGGFITNIASVTVKPNAPTDYDVKVSVAGTFNYPAREVFGAFGLMIFTDANNFFTLHTAHAGAANGDPQPHNINFVDTELKSGGSFTGRYNGLLYSLDNTFTDYDGSNAPINPVIVGTNTTQYHIHKAGTTITLSYKIGGGTETTLTTLTSADTDAYKAAAYTFLSDLSGKHIGLFAGPGYDSDLYEKVTFSGFSTTLPTVVPAPTFDDELNGTALSGAWSFNVPGNTPLNTEDKTHYNVSGGGLNITLQPGILQGNNARNVPSVTIGTGNDARDWYVEASVNAPFTTTRTYPSADLVFFSDANNFYLLRDENAGFIDPANPFSPTPGTQFADQVLYTNGGTANALYDVGDDGMNTGLGTGFPIIGPAVLRIAKTKGTGTASDVITISFVTTHQSEKTIAILDNTVTGAQKRLFDFLEKVDGKHIGFFLNSNNFDAVADTVRFDNLRTTLNIVQPAPGATVTGRIALEGVSKLSGIPAAVSLGTFHIEFRTPGTTTVLKAADVTLSPVGTTAFGAYSVSGVPAGTYDVAVNGLKQLRVVLPNVTVTGSAFTLADVTLPSGDATHDNIVDIGDFGVLVNAYGGDVTIAGSGYDIKADFNYDGVVDIGDFGILVNEYGNMGAM